MCVCGGHAAGAGLAAAAGPGAADGRPLPLAPAAGVAAAAVAAVRAAGAPDPAQARHQARYRSCFHSVELNWSRGRGGGGGIAIYDSSSFCEIFPFFAIDTAVVWGSWLVQVCVFFFVLARSTPLLCGVAIAGSIFLRSSLLRCVLGGLVLYIQLIVIV